MAVCWPSVREDTACYPAPQKLDVVAQVCNASPWEAEVARSERLFKAILRYIVNLRLAWNTCDPVQKNVIFIELLLKFNSLEIFIFRS